MKAARRLPDALARGYAATALVAVGTVVVHSNVGLNLWFVRGAAAIALAVVYAALLVLTVVRPTELLHRVAIPVGSLFWFGRGKAFFDLAIEVDPATGERRTDLMGAVVERGLLLASGIAVHLLVIALYRNLDHGEASR